MDSPWTGDDCTKNIYSPVEVNAGGVTRSYGQRKTDIVMSDK